MLQYSGIGILLRVRHGTDVSKAFPFLVGRCEWVDAGFNMGASKLNTVTYLVCDFFSRYFDCY